MAMKGAVFIILVSLLPLSRSIRPHPNNSSLPSTNSSTHTQPTNNRTFMLPLLHRTHPKIQRYFANYVSPIETDYFKKVFYVDFLISDAKTSAVAVFDTGSFFTWLLVVKGFDPTQSDSYNPVPCKTSLCSEVPSNTCTPDDKQCLYKLSYFDKSNSSGDVGVDTFHVYESTETGHDPNTTEGFPMVFGTGRDGTNKYKGVMGVSRHPLGLLTGLDVEYFSVCFPKQPKLTSYVRFGFDVRLSGRATPLVDNSWFLSFKASSITIAGTKLTKLASGPAPGAVFVFDSGAALTQLHPVAMSGVVRLVKDSVRALAMPFVAAGYELCYEGTDKRALMNLAFSLDLDGGGSLQFDFRNLWMAFSNFYCLAFQRSATDRSIFGVRQMEGWNFGFDFELKELSFYPDTC